MTSLIKISRQICTKLSLIYMALAIYILSSHLVLGYTRRDMDDVPSKFILIENTQNMSDHNWNAKENFSLRKFRNKGIINTAHSRNWHLHTNRNRSINRKFDCQNISNKNGHAKWSRSSYSLVNS